jgi:tetratricopeptide (TPR) repeat protein
MPEPALDKALPARSGLSRWLLWGLASVSVVLVSALTALSLSESPGRLRSRAEAAARAGDWNSALNHWRALNATRDASAVTYLGEARACLALGRALQAESSLRKSIEADPRHPEAWRLLLEILRVEDRTLEASHVGWEAYDKVRQDERRLLLRELTFSLLADLPDEEVRTILRRWIVADRDDVDARIALSQRMAALPRATDPDRKSILAELESIVASHPDHITAREVLVTALADAGEPQRGRSLLHDWPATARDARYWRLRGRWDLEYDNRPAEAAEAFRTALSELPQDWRTWYRLARAQRILKREDESREAAETVSRIRELLDPLTLGPKLALAVDHLDETSTLKDLATLSRRAGLARLERAWLAELEIASDVPGNGSP